MEKARCIERVLMKTMPGRTSYTQSYSLDFLGVPAFFILKTIFKLVIQQ